MPPPLTRRFQGPSPEGEIKRFDHSNFVLSLAFSLLVGFASAIPCANAASPSGYVNPLIDTHKSRWFFFSSACRPFGMVNLSPDTSVGGDWLHGYLYGETNIQCFSHVHCWQLYGVPVMPSIGELQSHKGLAAEAFSNP